MPHARHAPERRLMHSYSGAMSTQPCLAEHNDSLHDKSSYHCGSCY